MEHRLLSYKNSQISYYGFGTGPETVICFHGYGEDGTLYSFLEKHAGNQFVFYAIDLPFHGKTEWNEELLFTQNDLSQIIKEILSQNNYKQAIITDKLILTGFSLGGRIALSYYQAHPEMIKKIILLAPDGLKVNFWYWLCYPNPYWQQAISL